MVIQSERSTYRMSLSAALSLPARATEAPPVRKRAALSVLTLAQFAISPEADD